jgi:uncharacterized protein (TIRG00374 family)
MADHSAEPAIGISSKTILRGIRFFIFFTLIGTGIVIWWKTPYEFSALIHKIDWFFIIGLVPLIALDYILGGFRYKIFFNSKILPHISLRNCMRANLANIFMGAVTPFQTGGGAAQLYIFWRSGAKLSDSVLISLINYCATLLFFLVASLVVLFILPSTLFLNQLAPLIQGSFIIVASIVSLNLLILLFPSTGTAIIRFIMNLIPFRLFKLEKLRDRLLNTFTEEIQQFDQNFRRIRRYNKGTLILTLIITSILFFNKYVIGFIIARALHQLVPFWTFIGLQIINLFIIYFAPTPGASGIAELSSTWLMERVMSSEILVYFALLWRFFLTFLGAFIGGIILLTDLHAGVKNQFIRK